MEAPGYPYTPQHLEVDGVRLAYVDEGPRDAPPVWFMHGEPTWGYLWRGIVPHVLEAGYRAIVPDLPGFGRSDKPTDLEWYSYDRHTAAMAALLEELDLRDATMVCHDWGGPIGMRLFVEHADRFVRVAILDTGFFTGHQKMSDAWFAFRDFVQRTEDLPISFLVDGAVVRSLSDEEKAAYDAPFPDPASKAGTRAFPLMMPLKPDDPGAAEGARTYEAMKADPRPKLMLWAADDPILTEAMGRKLQEALRVPDERFVVVPGASHFLQEDQPDLIGRELVAFLRDDA